MKQKYRQYKENAITTASPGRVLLMLYSTAINSVRKARVAIEKKDIPEKCKHILKAQDIIHELASCLDFEKGGELSGRLEGLYDFISFQLTEAHINNTTEPLNNIEVVLLNLNDGWVEAVRQIESGKAQENVRNG